MGDRVLVVDDEPSILRVVAANLRARGYEALTAASGKVALTMVETSSPTASCSTWVCPTSAGWRSFAASVPGRRRRS